MEPPLKRKKTARSVDRSSCQLDRGKGEERVPRLDKGNGKDLDKTASIRDINVALHIAQKVVPPADEKFLDTLNNKELMASLVRGCARDLAFASAMHQRIDQLNEVNRTMDQEVHDLLEQVNALRVEISEAKEEKDVLRAQLSSLEEEKSVLEEEKSVLRAQLVSGEEERSRAVASRGELESECLVLQLSNEGLKREVLNANSKAKIEEELHLKVLHDCHEAVMDKMKAERKLLELQGSVKEQRVKAIRRWKERYLHEKCKEFAYELALSILRNCHNVCIPDGSDGPSFEDYTELMLPSELGLSLEEVREIAEKEREAFPDEVLDLISDEKEGSFGRACDQNNNSRK
ncbi:hypothetical protein K2173_022792 [Erythroxylum novogranatense]|uniref:Uncharacterized protein n=1 Tax=Erythroxylum novogranatense TaxID=1862640 RepID=A0AAV8SMQ7_9ROSI|nr:hypothetical protein K2173_022792 [Erythroxylum novogranatense]